jgi:glycosyltransferase involved in cell wall biosynthesis
MTLAFKARAQDPTIASYRYRVLEPIAFLKARGQQVEAFDAAYVDRYRTVVFSKAYGPEDRKLARRLKAAGKRVILDLCDDHFFNPLDLPKYREAREGLLAMIALCDKVVCSTPVLARSVQAHAGLQETPAVAPDAYEQASVPAGPPTPQGQPARLLWFGRHGSPNAPAGMADLLLVKDVLAEAQALRPFELVVCSDSEARFAEVSAGLPVPARFVAWTPQSFAGELARADAVLLPLSDNPFVAAKTHNRLTLALSAGVPVVADRLDSYGEFSPFCWIGDWRAGLEAVLLRPDEARARAAEARAYLQAHWSPEAVAPLWEAALDLPARPREPGRVVTPQLRPVTPAWAWFAQDGRARGPWLLAGEAADPAEVEAARREGARVMSLGLGFERTPCDLACVVDAEVLAAHGPALAEHAAFVLVPFDLHGRGWAAGRSLASWGADLPVLARLRDEGRLVGFDLWTGSSHGVDGDFATDEAPRALLAKAGVRRIQALGLVWPQPSVQGFEALPTIGQRRARSS